MRLVYTMVNTCMPDDVKCYIVFFKSKQIKTYSDTNSTVYGKLERHNLLNMSELDPFVYIPFQDLYWTL